MEQPVLIAGRAPQEGSVYDADICILSHLRLAETCAAIASARAQTGLTRHILVLDQGSPAAHCAALAAAIGDAPDIALFCLAQNHGVGAGRNRLAGLGHGRVIIGLDNDAQLAEPSVAARAVRRLAAAPDLAVIGFRIMAADQVSLDLTSWGYPRRLLAQAHEHFACHTFVGAGHAIARAAWVMTGGYDEGFFFTWEEYEFALRAIAQGWRLEYHGDLAIIHAVAAEARVTWQSGRWRQFVRNRLLIAHDWQNAPWRERYGVRLLFYALRGLVLGMPGPTWQAIAEARRMAANRPPRPMDAAMRRQLQGRPSPRPGPHSATGPVHLH